MTKLCPRGKAAAKRKFKVYPSAYANAYASKICAGKIKDPSGVKRKDFRGPKKADGGIIDFNKISQQRKKVSKFNKGGMARACGAVKGNRRKITKLTGFKIYGDLQKKTAVISFNIKNVHPYDIGSILDQMGIAVRTGHHCAQPIMDYFEIPGTVRASFSFYNTFDEIDIMVKGVQKAIKMLQ